MGGSSKFHRLLALWLQGVENHQQTNWQFWTLFSPVPRLGKLHRLATCEERGTKDRVASPPGSSTRSCPNSGRSQHLRVTVSLSPLGRRSLLLPSDAWSQERLWDWTPSSWSSYSTPVRLSNLGFATSPVLACTKSKFQRSGEEH